jgi:hypothetical protein
MGSLNDVHKLNANTGDRVSVSPEYEAGMQTTKL